MFLLGAGASSEAGAPLVKDFLTTASALQAKRQPASDFECFQRVLDAIDALQAVHPKTQMDLDNLEEVFGAFEMANMIGVFPGHAPEQIPELLLSFKRLLIDTLERTTVFRYSNGKVLPPESYDRFAKLVNALNAKTSTTRCSIITFNYDLALDWALHFNGVGFDYCLSEAAGPSLASKVPYLKMHGSLNWASASETKEIIPWLVSDYVSTRNWLLFDDGSEVALRMGSQLASDPPTHLCNGTLEPVPVIVPPAWNKTVYHERIARVWTRAARELSDAKNVVVSGYSLFGTDIYFKYLFALGSVGRSRIRRFWVYDPDATVGKRFEDLVSPGVGFRYEPWRFSGMVNTLLANLRGGG